MKFAILSTPRAEECVAGRRSSDGIAWALKGAASADHYGLDEVFFAEHYRLGREPCPAPDLMIAAAAQRTRRIKLGLFGKRLQSHNAASSAYRMLALNQMTGGRYIAGLTACERSDCRLLGIGTISADDLSEGLDIADAIWNTHECSRAGGGHRPAEQSAFGERVPPRHRLTMRSHGPERVMLGTQPISASLTRAALRDYSPVSASVHEDFLRMHWETYSGTSEAAGHRPGRSRWRIMRDWLVADTDEEARRLASSGPIRTAIERNLAAYRRSRTVPLLTGGAIDPEDVSVDWLVEEFFIVGSPETVAQKIRALYAYVGGFGTLLGTAHAAGNAEVWQKSWELTGSKVAALVEDLSGD